MIHCGAQLQRQNRTRNRLKPEYVQSVLTRLEALGAIGLARVSAVSGALGVALLDAEDPFARQRQRR